MTWWRAHGCAPRCPASRACGAPVPIARGGLRMGLRLTHATACRLPSLAAAQGTTVRFASWSDAASSPPLINNYIDNTLGAAVQAAYGITMRRIPLAATSDAVFSVTSAARTGVAGDIDLIWINGKNFKARATRAAPRRMCQHASCQRRDGARCAADARA